MSTTGTVNYDAAFGTSITATATNSTTNDSSAFSAAITASPLRDGETGVNIR